MELTDTELRERLLASGFVAPPITSTSRGVLLKKLQALECGGQMKRSNVSDSEDTEDNTNGVVHSTPNFSSVNSPRYRVPKSNFFPENIGMYSRCYVRHVDFWDKIGVIGTTVLLIAATLVVFFLFKCLGTWSDQRFRGVHLFDAVSPKCSQGGVAGATCINDADLKFTEKNLNAIRAAVHQATISDRCSRSSYKSEDFVGMYPLFKYDVVEQMLTKEQGFKPHESKMLLQNAKVLFKANPRYDIKVLKEGLLYRNHRVLRTCGYSSWNDSAYTYALYMVSSFAVVWIIYKVNRWVNKLGNDGDQERRRLIKDIYDILKQNEKQSAEDYLSVKQVQEWISSVVSLRPKLWDEVMAYIRKHETGLVIEKRSSSGQNIEILRLKNN